MTRGMGVGSTEPRHARVLPLWHHSLATTQQQSAAPQHFCMCQVAAPESMIECLCHIRSHSTATGMCVVITKEQRLTCCFVLSTTVYLCRWLTHSELCPSWPCSSLSCEWPLLAALIQYLHKLMLCSKRVWDFLIYCMMSKQTLPYRPCTSPRVLLV